MGDWMPSPELAAHFGLIFVIFNMLVLSAAFMVWMERKVCAYIQDRSGPNRVGFEGLLQPFADVFKLLLKEQLTDQQMLDGIRRVRDRAVAANPASDIARLSEQLVKMSAPRDSLDSPGMNGRNHGFTLVFLNGRSVTSRWRCPLSRSNSWRSAR